MTPERGSIGRGMPAAQQNAAVRQRRLLPFETVRQTPPAVGDDQQERNAVFGTGQDRAAPEQMERSGTGREAAVFLRQQRPDLRLTFSKQSEDILRELRHRLPSWIEQNSLIYHKQPDIQGQGT